MSYIPEPVRRELRQEVNFGCAICGCPVLEMHHIIPRSEKEHNDPNHMIALCRNHHALAGPQAEGLTPDQLYEYKQNPYNSNIVDYDFYFESGMPILEFGGGECLLVDNDEMTLLHINGEDIVKISYLDDVLRFSAKLYNENDDLVAELDENEWAAYTDEVWDLTYNGNHFKIWHEPRDIGIEVEFDSDSDKIFMRGNFYKKGTLVRFTPTKAVYPGKNYINVGVTQDSKVVHYINLR